MYLSWPELESLWSLSYLSTKYWKIARVSLCLDQSSTSNNGHSGHLPNDEVVILVVDDGGDATVGVDLQVVWGLMLSLAEIEVHRLIC